MSEFKEERGLDHHSVGGYFLTSYAGVVSSDGYSERGSSGGSGSWIAARLLETGQIDAVIHVKRTADPGNSSAKPMFGYAVSKSLSEIQEGAK